MRAELTNEVEAYLSQSSVDQYTKILQPKTQPRLPFGEGRRPKKKKRRSILAYYKETSEIIQFLLIPARLIEQSRKKREVARQERKEQKKVAAIKAKATKNNHERKLREAALKAKKRTTQHLGKEISTKNAHQTARVAMILELIEPQAERHNAKVVGHNLFTNDVKKWCVLQLPNGKKQKCSIDQQVAFIDQSDITRVDYSGEEQFIPANFNDNTVYADNGIALKTIPYTP